MGGRRTAQDEARRETRQPTPEQSRPPKPRGMQRRRTMRSGCNSKTEAGLSLLGGALLGAAAMYLLDPESGRRRREYIGEMAEDKLGPAWDTARAASAALAEKAGDYSAHLSDRAHDAATNLYSRAGDAADAVGDSGSGLFDTLRHFGRGIVGHASGAASNAADYASNFS